MQHRRIVTARHQHCGGITFLVAPRTYAIDSDAICADLVTWIRLRAERLSWLKASGRSILPEIGGEPQHLDGNGSDHGVE